jgi:hypothetical protein
MDTLSPRMLRRHEEGWPMCFALLASRCGDAKGDNDGGATPWRATAWRRPMDGSRWAGTIPLFSASVWRGRGAIEWRL